MTMTAATSEIYKQITSGTPKFGDLKKLAREIKRDHEMALELWATGEYYPRLMATLIFDKKLLTQEALEQIAADAGEHSDDEREQIADWLMANQLNKDKKTMGLMDTWEHHDQSFLRRIYFYNQGRLRWTGKVPPENTDELLSAIEERIGGEVAEVQWAMNFTAAQIGIWQPEYRDRCVALGERHKLYIDDPVPRGCVSKYLPLWIETEVAKLA